MAGEQAAPVAAASAAMMVALGSVPRLKQRLDCFLYRKQTNELLHRLYGEVKWKSAA